MNEYTCNRCGFTAKAWHVEGIIQASKDHDRSCPALSTERGEGDE